MPYIITPGIQTTDAGTNFDSHAVETIAEARDWIALYVCDRYAGENFGQYQDAWRELGNTGGQIGPLPDDVVIDVQEVTWEHLAFRTRMKPEFVRAHNHGGDIAALHAAMLDAFNAT